MAPEYKLSYFNVRALGEPIRFLLSYGNIEFEDHRIEHADWPKLKDTTPFGQLPILEYKGKKATQSAAIARYVAKQVGLTGKTDWENLEIDAIVDTIGDLRLKLIALFQEKDEEKKKVLIETAVKETIPYYLSRLDKIAKDNNGYLATGKLTWADLYFAPISHLMEVGLKTDLLTDYPNLKALREKVLAIPQIKKWVEKRPKTEF